MKKKCFQKIACLFTLLIFQSCTQDNFVHNDTTSSLKEELKITPVVEKIMEKGYDIKNIVEYDDYYVVERDLFFSKNIDDYSTSKSKDPAARHYHDTHLVSSTNVQSMDVFFGVSPVNQVPPDPWVTAFQDAITAWNSIHFSCIQFNVVTTHGAADILVLGDRDPLNFDPLNDGGPGTDGVFGRADAPSNGNPGYYISINLDFYNSGNPISQAQKQNIIAHELGHAIGFEHTDTGGVIIPGTGLLDPNSIMRADIIDKVDNSFTNDDVFAAVYLYNTEASCGIGDPPFNGSITGANELCVGGLLGNTYTWTGSHAVTWQESNPTPSSPISIVQNGTSNSINVFAITKGSEELIALVSGHPVGTLTINVKDRPTQLSFPASTVTGPNVIDIGNSGEFLLNDDIVDETNVTWVVYSYNYPNASQYFQIQTSKINNHYRALVQVAANTPLGSYVVQCRLSNNCGTYYLEKTFTVDDSGPPVIKGL